LKQVKKLQKTPATAKKYSYSKEENGASMSKQDVDFEPTSKDSNNAV
jgi:hypothetical protein